MTAYKVRTLDISKPYRAKAGGEQYENRYWLTLDGKPVFVTLGKHAVHAQCTRFAGLAEQAMKRKTFVGIPIERFKAEWIYLVQEPEFDALELVTK